MSASPVTPLANAHTHKHTMQATELLRLGADPTAKNKEGHRASHFSASHGHTEILELFATRGVDLDVEDKRGRTPLHYSAAGTASMGFMNNLTLHTFEYWPTDLNTAYLGRLHCVGLAWGH